jgi:hypothetical protein
VHLDKGLCVNGVGEAYREMLARRMVMHDGPQTRQL